MNNMFENKCGYMFDTNCCFMVARLDNINDKVTLDRMLIFSECTSGGFRIPFDDIKGEECSPHAWG